MRRPRDSQRSKLYGWEFSKLYGWELSNLKTERLGLAEEFRTRLSVYETQELVYEVWRSFAPVGTRVPDVRLMGNRGRGAWFPSEWEIRLSTQYDATCHAWYVLHETAHALMTARGLDTNTASHGPQFCAAYANLLGRFTNLSRGDVVCSMRAARLKVDGRVA
jgi:hypothetical protein